MTKGTSENHKVEKKYGPKTLEKEAKRENAHPTPHTPDPPTHPPTPPRHGLGLGQGLLVLQKHPANGQALPGVGIQTREDIGEAPVRQQLALLHPEDSRGGRAGVGVGGCGCIMMTMEASGPKQTGPRAKPCLGTAKKIHRGPPAAFCQPPRSWATPPSAPAPSPGAIASAAASAPVQRSPNAP